MTETAPNKRERKPRARQREVIFGCIAERLDVMEQHNTDAPDLHIARLRELMDELRRATNGKESDE